MHLFSFRNKGFRAAAPGGERGFTLLFASLVAGLVLSIGIALLSIALRELALSAAGRESELAFYAADGGAECALYWDLQAGGVFPVSNAPNAPSATPICNGQTLALQTILRDPRSATTLFTVNYARTACAFVTVAKDDPDGDGKSETTVESRGQNDCTDKSNPRRVERAVRVFY